MDEKTQHTSPSTEDKGTYFVYGMAAGLVVGIVVYAITDSKLYLSLCVAIGMLIGAFIKKK